MVIDREHAKTANELSAALREHVLVGGATALLIGGSGVLARVRRFDFNVGERQPEPCEARPQRGAALGPKVVGRFGPLTVINTEGANSVQDNETGDDAMSRRIKMTLPDPLVAQLEALAEERGEPTSRIAAQLVCTGIEKRSAEQTSQAAMPFVGQAMDPDLDRPGGGRPTVRAGVPGAARRLWAGASTGGRRDYAAWRPGPAPDEWGSMGA